MKISASMLKTWMSCPLQAKFKEVESRPYSINGKTSFGTCMHDALEFYNHTGDIDKTLARFETTWANPELLKAVPVSWPKGTSYGELKKKGMEVLKTYHKKNVWDNRDIISAEHKFCVPFGEHELSGIVDLIEARPLNKSVNELTIVDYKTAGKRPYGDDLKLDIQFTVYYYASLQPEFWIGYDDDRYKGMPNGLELWEEFKDAPRKVVWYHLLDNKEINAGPRDEEDFGRLYRCVEEIVKAIEHDVYVPNINGASCIWCDYTDICPVMIPPYSETPALIGKGKYE